MTKHALSNQGGRALAHGDPELARLLVRALEASREEPDSLTHGFHSYPARMHPAIARRVLQSFPGGLVADPFCGSGTVLVEARVAGRPSLGVDLNPVAVWLAEVKTDIRSPAARQRFRQLVRSIGAASEERVRARVDARAPLPPAERKWWGPHVLKELAGLREEIWSVGHPTDRRLLAMVFSAILVKVSNQRSDTAEREAPRRIRKGLSTEIFVRKGLELADRWDALAEAAGSGSPRPRIVEGDALRFPRFLSRGQRAELILSSPPYGGTYDYVDHHARRYAWLGLDPSTMRRAEVGARRHLRGPEAFGKWDRQVLQMLRAMRSGLAPGGQVVLLVGDGQLGDRRVDAAQQLRRLAPQAGLRAVAGASQLRPDFTGRHKRREHLVLLVGDGDARPPRFRRGPRPVGSEGRGAKPGQGRRPASTADDAGRGKRGPKRGRKLGSKGRGPGARRRRGPGGPKKRR